MPPAPILVLGSLNADLVLRAARLPQPGETLEAGDLAIYPGGKGANQAFAAARLGARVSMFGAVGRDAFAALLLDSLRSVDVNVEGIVRLPRATGCASITVLPNGENAILLSPGANALVDRSVVQAMPLAADSLALCQLEIPMPAVEALFEASQAAGARVILDPAPAQPLPSELLRRAHVLTPNQTECAILLARPAQPPQTFAQAREACVELHRRGAPTVIVKMGAQGCFVSSPGESFAAEAHPVEAVDATAAGDTFNAGLAAGLAEGLPLRAAVDLASAAAAICVTRPGAQASAPTRAEADELLRKRD